MTRDRSNFARLGILARLVIGLVAGMLLVGGSAEAGPAQQTTPEATVEATLEPVQPTPTPTEPPAEPTPTGPPLAAGDTFANGTFTRISQVDVQNAIDFRIFCSGSDGAGPGTVRAECDVLALDLLLLGPGLFDPSAATLAAIWNQIEWTLEIDGRPIDMESFGYIEQDDERTTTTGETIPVKERFWAIAIKDLAPGKYTLRQVYNVRRDISTSTGDIPAGEYEIIYQLNVGAENYALPCRQFTPGSDPAAAPSMDVEPPTTPGYIGLQFRYESCGGRISVILPDGAAAQSRLRVDDLIVAIDGVKFVDNPEYIFVYRRLNAGTEVILTIERNARFLEIPVTLGAPPRSFPTATPRP